METAIAHEPETRTIVETKIYYLSLADMRGWVDDCHPIAAFDSIEKLQIWMESQNGPWTDTNEDKEKDRFDQVHSYEKTFRKDTPLEWYNPPENTEPSEHPGHGGFVGFQWVRMETFTLSVPFNPEPCIQ